MGDMNSSTYKLQRAYAVFLGVLTAVVGLCFIVQLAEIYFADAAPLFTYEGVAARVRLLCIPLSAWAVAIVCGFFFVPAPSSAAGKDEGKVYRSLLNRIPEGEGEEYLRLRARAKHFCTLRSVLWLLILVFSLVAAVFCGVRLFSGASYTGEVNAAVLSLLRYIAPWLAAVVAMIVGMLVFERIAYRLMLPELKRLLVLGKRGTRAFAPRARAKSLLSSPWTVISLRTAVLVCALVFLVLGALNGGANDVLGKAVMICTECIGLG